MWCGVAEVSLQKTIIGATLRHRDVPHLLNPGIASRRIVLLLELVPIHTYPVWEYKGIEEGLSYTIENYKAVAEAYPDKQVIITEAGWATNANGFGIDPKNVNEEFQEQYYQELMAWAEKEQILVYYFEAFDENWKGSDDPLEPEKHWGIYNADRTPKLVMQG